jgi:hypothetical protein
MLYSILIKRGLYFLSVSILVPLLLFPLVVHSEVFNVTNEDELRTALSASESNGENDTIHIAAGLYHTNGEPFTYDTDEDFSLTVNGEGAGLTILDGGGINRVLEINAVSDVAVTSLKGLTIQNGYYESMPEDMSAFGGAGIFIISQNLIIQDCELFNNKLPTSGCGGGLYASVHTITMINNIFNGNSAYEDGGGGCLMFPNNLSKKNTLNLTNNTFTLNSSDGNGGGIYIYYPSSCPRFECVNGEINIYNNILYNNVAKEGSDIYVVYSFTKILPPPDSPDTTVVVEFDPINLYNNDLSDFSYTALDCDNFNQDNILRQNITYTCSFDNNQGNNIDEAPLFVDAQAGDVSLQPDSPCINAGDTNAPDAPDTDIFGDTRLQPPDMGAVDNNTETTSDGGCTVVVVSRTFTPVTSSPVVLMTIPVFIPFRRIIKRYRRGRLEIHGKRRES